MLYLQLRQLNLEEVFVPIKPNKAIIEQDGVLKLFVKPMIGNKVKLDVLKQLVVNGQVFMNYTSTIMSAVQRIPICSKSTMTLTIQYGLASQLALLMVLSALSLQSILKHPKHVLCTKVDAKQHLLKMFTGTN